MCRAMITLCTLVILAAGTTAGAADRDQSQDRSASAVETSPAGDEGTTPPVPPGASRAVLTTLYASFIALQAYDAHTTVIAVGHGAAESNPLMRELTSHPILFCSVKAASTVASIYMTEHLWRQHRRKEAIGLMIISNGLMAAIAAHNASVLRRVR